VGGALAVATPHHEATAAGERALAAGGNAIDAALAAAAALTVVYPHNCALGGDLFALVRSPDGRVTNVNASGPAGSLASSEGLTEMPRKGPLTVTVPGCVAGFGALHELGASLPWSAVFDAALSLAGGVPVARSLAGAIAEADLSDAGLREVFAGLREGDTLRQPALAETLSQIAAGGPSRFYSGPLAERWLSGVADGFLTAADVAGFAAELGEPLRARFRGLDVLTSPPNSTGVLLAHALVALEASAVSDPLGADAATLAEIFRTGFRARDRLLGDPRMAEIDLDPWLRPTGDTVAVVVVDDEGRAVSLIQSLFAWFGAGILEPSTGVLLHNRGAMFSLEPGHPDELAPGRRPVHTLMPVLVERDGALVGVLGTMGGKVHAQIHTQVLLRLLDGASPQEAVDAPRFVVGGMELGEPDDLIRIEEGCTAVLDGAVGVPRGDELFGNAQAIWLDPEPRAGSDFRADP
jgi:gamma-glutamyltranspeptidase